MSFTTLDGIDDALADKLSSNRHEVARRLNELFAADHSVPFIARYRAVEVGIDDSKVIALAKQAYDDALSTIAYRTTIMKALTKASTLTPAVTKSLNACRNTHQLQDVYGPMKPEPPKSLANRARQLGLEAAALQLLDGRHVNLQSFVKYSTIGLSTLNEVETGVRCIIASIVVKHAAVIDVVKRVTADVKSHRTTLNVKLSKTAEKHASGQEIAKFKQYHSASFRLSAMHAAQIAAMNRGESLKILTISVTLDPKHETDVKYAVHNELHRKIPSALRHAIVDDVWTRILRPQCERSVRSRLRESCQRSCLSVFSRNVRQVLLQRPLGRRPVLGVDPGFKHGVKCALVMADGSISHYTTIALPQCHVRDAMSPLELCQTCVSLLHGERELFVSIGNGTGYRETETMFAALIKDGAFGGLKVKYCITNEAGSSVYSASTKASKEHTNDMPMIYRSAVSIARRLQDPMMEMIKMPPKSIGHDIAETKLTKAAVEQLELAVAEVGVDVNTANEQLLQRVPGISAALAANVVAYRTQNGHFINRQQLNEVKGLGKKSFEQCAGFVTVQSDDEENDAPPKKKRVKMTVKTRRNPLDATIVHPESYHIAESLITGVGLTTAAIGGVRLCSAMKSVAGELMKTTAEKHKVDVASVKQIAQMLAKPCRYDYGMGPVFRAGIASMSSLVVGETMTGSVSNVTDFGAFVDIGCGQDGLIPRSSLPHNTNLYDLLQIRDQITVKLTNVDVRASRIALKYCDHVKVL